MESVDETKETNKIGKKVQLTLLNGVGYVFNAEDYMALRRQRIVGTLVGVMQKRGWSCTEYGLPAELSPCETQLAVEKGLAVLLSKAHTLLSKPTEQELLEARESDRQVLLEQAQLAKEEKLQETQQHMDRILKGKREKLLKADEVEKALQLTPQLILQEVSNKFVFDAKNALQEIPLAHARPHEGRVVELPTLRSLKYSCYCNLYEREYFITPGCTFGGDFLVYPGDPLLYHSSHIVNLLEDNSLNMPCSSLISKVRLAVSVNKQCVVAYFGDAQEQQSALEDFNEKAIEPQTKVDEQRNQKETPHIQEDKIECQQRRWVHYQTIQWLKSPLDDEKDEPDGREGVTEIGADETEQREDAMQLSISEEEADTDDTDKCTGESK